MSRKTRRKKFIRKPKETEAQKKARAKRSLITLCSIVVVIVATVVIGYIISQDKKLSNTELFESKAELLMQQVLSGDRDNELSGEIEDGLPKSAVFISISNGDERARVFTGTASITRNTTIAIIQKVVIDISANIGIVITSTLFILYIILLHYSLFSKQILKEIFRASGSKISYFHALQFCCDDVQCSEVKC